MKTFTHNVIILGVENQLMRLIPEILTPEKVGNMEDVELSTLAAESSGIRERRKILVSETETLEGGLNLCRQYSSRRRLYPRASKANFKSRAISISSTALTQVDDEEL